MNQGARVYLSALTIARGCNRTNEFDNARCILQKVGINSLGRDKNMPPVPVLTEFEWARIIAKAYLDGTTVDLEKDPKQFVDGVRRADDPPGMKIPSGS
jgi:hypothetical protein